MDRNDVELGEDLPSMHGNKRPGLVVSVRLEYDDAERLLTVAEHAGKNVVEVAKEAILSYLHARVE